MGYQGPFMNLLVFRLLSHSLSDLPRVVERPGVDGHLLRGRDGGDEALEHRVVEDHAEDLPGRACLTCERI